MNSLLLPERKATQLVDRHGNPLRPFKPSDLAVPSTPRNIVVTPAPASLRVLGGDVDHSAIWEAEQRQREEDEALFKLTGLRNIRGAAAGSWTFTNGGRTSLLNGTFDIDSDTWKMALFLSTSNIGAASTTYAGLTNEHSNANGYTTGGIAQTLTLSGTTTVTVAASASPTWTASGGSIVARFAVIYEVSGNVLCYCLLDSTPADVTTTTGNTFTVATTTSIFTLA